MRSCETARLNIEITHLSVKHTDLFTWLRLMPCLQVAKFTSHRNSVRYYFVLENRISVQIGAQPIQYVCIFSL